MKHSAALVSVVYTLALGLAACGSQASGSGGDLPATEVQPGPASTNGPSSAAAINKIPLGEEGAWTGNIVSDGGRVLVNFGPLHNVQSADPMKHVYLRGNPGVTPDRVFLAGTVMDINSNVTLNFEIDYTDEESPIDLVQHGHLNLINRGPARLATAGFATVSKLGTGRLAVSFSGLELGTATGSGITAEEPMPDGSVAGDVERVCRKGLERDDDNPFCDVPE